MTFLWIDDPKALAEVVADISTVDRYAIDTEFHRESTYYPRLALIQLKWRDTTALVDPLQVDPRGMSDLFNSQVLAVFHAAQQDLEVLRHAAKCAPKRIFDCQLAAGFVGYSTPSLATLTQSIKSIALPKGNRLTDWLRRPLTDAQCKYAADDVAHLLDLHDELLAQLTKLGRVVWVEEACSDLLAKPSGPVDASDAWLKLKQIRSMRGASSGVAQALAQWREEKAKGLDAPPRRLMSDMALLGIAQRVPKSVEELASIRGVDDRQLSSENCREIMKAVREGAVQKVKIPVGELDDIEKVARPALTLLSAWIGELARRHRIDPALLATRSDIVALVGKSQQARLLTGWRAELVGQDLRGLISGRLGLSLGKDGHLTLIGAASTQGE